MSNFKTVTDDERKAAVKERAGRGLPYIDSELDIFTPNDGENTIRIVPPLGTDTMAKLWGLEVWVYYLNGGYILSNKTFDSNAHDPIAEYFFGNKDKPGVDADHIKKFRGMKRQLMYIIDLNDPDKADLKLWAAPPQLVDQFVGLAKNRKTGALIPLEDPSKGRIVYFTKSGKGLQTKYAGVEIDGEAYPIDGSLCEIMDEFKDILVVPTQEELETILANALSGDTGEDGDTPSPRSTREARSRPSSRNQDATGSASDDNAGDASADNGAGSTDEGANAGGSEDNNDPEPADKSTDANTDQGSATGSSPPESGSEAGGGTGDSAGGAETPEQVRERVKQSLRKRT